MQFCSLTFNQFTFAGAHNAGTGLSSNKFDCMVTNHDLNFEEMLDFGIRYFDIDVKYERSTRMLYACKYLGKYLYAIMQYGW